mmetsp:Transcript_4684/g.13455  ORF Transcript_4684/g.13455 Transcript_4684/m.13455 type:complete len:441 (+) Transcript_4684:382-1704(+)
MISIVGGLAGNLLGIAVLVRLSVGHNAFDNGGRFHVAWALQLPEYSLAARHTVARVVVAGVPGLGHGAADHRADVEGGQQILVHLQRRPDDDFVDVFAGQHRQGALVEVHEGQVRPPPIRHILITVQTHQQEVPLLPCALEKVHVAGVKEIEGAIHVHNLCTRRRHPPLAELHDAAGGGHEARHGCAGVSGGGFLLCCRCFRRRRRSGSHAIGPLRPAELPRQRLVLRTQTGVDAGAHEHAAHNVGAGHPLRALNQAEPVDLLGILICVSTVWQDAGIIAMDHVVNMVLVEQLVQEGWCKIIGHPCEHLVDPFDGLHHGVAFLLIHHGGPLAPADLAVGHQAHHQMLPQRFGLSQCIGVPIMHHVKAAIHVHAYGRPLSPALSVAVQEGCNPSRDCARPVVVVVRSYEVVCPLRCPPKGTAHHWHCRCDTHPVQHIPLAP